MWRGSENCSVVVFSTSKSSVNCTRHINTMPILINVKKEKMEKTKWLRSRERERAMHGKENHGEKGTNREICIFRHLKCISLCLCFCLTHTHTLLEYYIRHIAYGTGHTHTHTWTLDSIITRIETSRICATTMAWALLHHYTAWI